MKFFEKRLMLPLIAFSALSFVAWGQNSATTSDAPEINYNVTTPWPLKPVDNTEASKNPSVPQLNLPQLPGPVKPWTGTDAHNKPMNFQIAIVTDRNGGMRPGIFKSALEKLNLMQPEFVMCIGDLIHGYSHDPKAVEEMWDDFQEVISKLTMPFFYLPGNHDLTNEMQTEKWHKRIGPTYYHFVYGNVLFLCVNTEDGKQTNISDEQVEYFRKVLDENKDVRWTLVFMHKPLWSNYYRNLSEANEKELKQMKETNWYAMEQLLKDRQYTVFAGHVHSYTQYIRNGKKLYSLATTGGGSSLRGAKTYGRFDQFVWLTMTDDGPVLANLALDGIYPADLRISEETSLLHDVETRGVHAEVAVTDPLPFKSANLTVNLENPATRPLTLKLVAPKGAVKFSPKTLDLTLAPKEKKQITFALNGSNVDEDKDLSGLALEWTATYKVKGRPDLVSTERTALRFDVSTVAKPAAQAVTVDGNMAEWADSWSRTQGFLQVVGAKHALLNSNDVSFKYAVKYDTNNVYFGFQVKDDDVLDESVKGHSMVDALRLFVLPDGADKPLRVLANPAKSGAGKIKGGKRVKAACVTTDEGYNVEIAVPVSLISKAGADWKKFRMNVQINDDDDIMDTRRSKQWWRPDWDSSASYKNSGTVVRGN